MVTRKARCFPPRPIGLTNRVRDAWGRYESVLGRIQKARPERRKIVKTGILPTSGQTTTYVKPRFRIDLLLFCRDFCHRLTSRNDGRRSATTGPRIKLEDSVKTTK